MAATFSADISRYVAKAKRRETEFVRRVCMEAARRVIVRTPVDTGFARSQWQTSMDPAELQPGDVFRMWNNTEYILVLEYGWSQQAPAGMVRITLAELPAIAQQVLGIMNP